MSVHENAEGIAKMSVHEEAEGRVKKRAHQRQGEGTPEARRGHAIKIQGYVLVAACRVT
jgi:hypothetical protein